MCNSAFSIASGLIFVHNGALPVAGGPIFMHNGSLSIADGPIFVHNGVLSVDGRPEFQQRDAACDHSRVPVAGSGLVIKVWHQFRN